MGKYAYLLLGIVLGISCAIYFYESRQEKIEKIINQNKKIFSTEKLDITMQNVVNRIADDIKVLKRDLTEEEKNKIIIQCYKEKFKIE